MNSTKIWFGFFVIFLLAVAIFAPITIRPWIEGKKIIIGGLTLFEGPVPILAIENFTTYTSPYHNSCYVSIPDRSMIVRIDDIRAFSEASQVLITELLKNNVSITLGIIPRQLEEDRQLILFLKSIKGDPRVEIAQHGVFHNETDNNLTETNLFEGLNKIETLLGVKPIVYSTPFNNDISPENKEIIAKYFKGITSGWGILKEGSVAEIGHTVSNFNISQNNKTNISDIAKICEENLDRLNYCIVLLHPQEFTTNIANPVNVSYEKLQELDSLIISLKKLDANFVTFKNIITCSNKTNITENIEANFLSND